MSCQLMWQNMLHFSINRQSWKSEENKKLFQIIKEESARNRGRPDWDKVATELGSQRTGFQCLMRYKQISCQRLDRRRWSQDEDNRLMHLVEKCRLHNYVPWTKISYYMFNRNKDQCYRRYTGSLKPFMRKGTFTYAEDCVILVGNVVFDGIWAKLIDFIPNRTPAQIHSRFHSFLKADFRRFSHKEDAELLKLVKIHGTKDWKKVSECLSSKRTRGQCRLRFLKIYGEFVKDPSRFSLAKCRKAMDGSPSLSWRRQKSVYDFCEKKINSFIESIRSSTTGEDGNMDVLEEQSFHVTPNGMKVPKNILLKFIQSLKPELPQQKIEAKKLKPKLDPNQPMPVKYAPQITIQTAKGTIQYDRPTVGRKPFASTASDYSKHLDVQLAARFRPSWPSKVRPSKTILNKNNDHFLIKILFQNPIVRIT